MSGAVKAIARLWWAGCWEALQLQRCIVFCVLDRSGQLLAKVAACVVLNGVIYLGSIAAHTWLLQPAVRWLLQTHVAPVMGDGVAATWEDLLGCLFSGLWLMPAYVISMGVSCIWYTQMASLAFQVTQQQQQQQQAASTPLVGALLPAAGAAQVGAGPAAGALEGVAQELYRVLFFLVFYAQVALVGCVPYVGFPLSVVFLSWLYAFYCYDYKWGLQGVRLPERLAYFEHRWAFFAGFGFPCVACTVLLPFYLGAGVCNLLFPLFVLVACDSDPAMRHVAAGSASLGRLRIFHLAQWPTDRLIGLVFGRADARSKQQRAQPSSGSSSWFSLSAARRAA